MAPLPPTGPPTASASSSRVARRDPAPAVAATAGVARARGAPAASSSSTTAASGFRFVAGADEAGRGCLAGPLVAAAVLFDLERLGPRDVRALGALNDSKQHTPEAREVLLPDRAAHRDARRRSCRRCARGHRRPRPAPHEPRRAARGAAAGSPRPGAILPAATASPVGRSRRATRAAPSSTATPRAPPSPPPRIVAKVTRDRFMHRADARHPGWEFAAHVGYSTPEHRDAIQRLGVSPLHRMSFRVDGVPAALRWLPRSERALEVVEARERRRARRSRSPIASKRSRATAAGSAPPRGRPAPCAAPARAWRRAARPTGRPASAPGLDLAEHQDARRRRR